MHMFNQLAQPVVKAFRPIHELPTVPMTAQDIANRLTTFATDFGAARGAELVGMRRDESGELIENPDARWAISDTTRETLTDLVTNAVALHWDFDQLADKITDTGVFSDARAEMIARTEINRAQNAAVLEMARLAKERDPDWGLKKIWTLGANPCVLCQEAAAIGAVDIDEDFGDAGDGTPLHPNCECDLDLVAPDEE